MTNDRLASFGKQVVRVATAGDKVAATILHEAGRELGLAAIAVIKTLRMENDEFPVAYVGGVYGAGELVLAPMRDEIKKVATKAYLAKPIFKPTIAAARIAQAHLFRELALAV